jgi:hypothetical protein
MRSTNSSRSFEKGALKRRNKDFLSQEKKSWAAKNELSLASIFAEE